MNAIFSNAFIRSLNLDLLFLLMIYCNESAFSSPLTSLHVYGDNRLNNASQLDKSYYSMNIVTPSPLHDLIKAVTTPTQKTSAAHTSSFPECD